MLAVGSISEYNAQGRKIRELKDFLRQHVEYRTVADDKEFQKMKQFISRQVTELNSRYPQTVAIQFKVEMPGKYGHGYLRFNRPDGRVSIITLGLYSVTPFGDESKS